MREVTERDLRHPKFSEGEPSDYEFRSDGAIVRKDRWEMTVHAIKSAVGDHRREFEVADVVAAVKALVAQIEGQPDPDEEA